jgi:predicted tellurium resistance membrane protein TerC
MDWLADPNVWASFLTLAALEVVLGIDNLVFISVATARLPEARQASAQRIGLLLALGMRVALLASLVWLVALNRPIITLFDFALSWRDLVLLAGGLFLLVKGTLEIHHSVEGDGEESGAAGSAAFFAVIGQIVMLDLVFSIDSVVTAIGLTDQLPIMVAAVVVAILVMMFAAKPTSEFIKRHPTSKMLALSFLLLIGMALIADGLHFHIPRGYLYFAIAFSIGVEALNLLAGRRRKRGVAVKPE